MAGGKLSTLEFVLVLVVALAIGGCSSTPTEKSANWSPNKLYAEAKDEMNSGGYEKAIPLLEKLEGRAAGTPLAQQAQIDKAYAQYKSGETAQAIPRWTDSSSCIRPARRWTTRCI